MFAAQGVSRKILASLDILAKFLENICKTMSEIGKKIRKKSGKYLTHCDVVSAF